MVAACSPATHEPARSKGYSTALKERVIEMAQSRRSERPRWIEIARELGIAFETVLDGGGAAEAVDLRKGPPLASLAR